MCSLFPMTASLLFSTSVNPGVSPGCYYVLLMCGWHHFVHIKTDPQIMTSLINIQGCYHMTPLQVMKEASEVQLLMLEFNLTKSYTQQNLSLERKSLTCIWHYAFIALFFLIKKLIVSCFPANKKAGYGILKEILINNRYETNQSKNSSVCAA